MDSHMFQHVGCRLKGCLTDLVHADRVPTIVTRHESAAGNISGGSVHALSLRLNRAARRVLGPHPETLVWFGFVPHRPEALCWLSRKMERGRSAGVSVPIDGARHRHTGRRRVGDGFTGVLTEYGAQRKPWVQASGGEGSDHPPSPPDSTRSSYLPLTMTSATKAA